ncbi:MAG TPA: DNA topoisomerase IV subunit A [Spirochaetia bacterium]|nr:DNA topoisomerase IV subunit A [Spirochaetia bacterium]
MSPQSQLKPLMEGYFLDYASYVIMDRAIPDLRDGCKPVQRRILHTLFEMNDGKFHKVANVIGEAMKLHPHGDASIGDALVVLSNKEYFIDKQGNFGNIFTGHPAAAARYIECRLTPLALETLFNPALTEYIPSYDGRRREPKELPAKVPVLLMLGAEGIAVGMATTILPHNFPELLDALVSILTGEKIALYPDFPQGGLMDVSEYSDGVGKVKVRALIEKVSGVQKLVIREVPFTTTTTSLIASIESAVQKGKVSVSKISDFTSDHVEIELALSRGAEPEKVIDQLYANTDCEVAISSNMVVIRNERPVELGVSDYLKEFSLLLKKQVKAELEHELARLEDRRHWLTLERIFIENRVYKRLEKAATEEAIRREVYAGMKPFSKQFVRAMTDDDVQRLLDLRIRRISAYDLKKNRGEIDDIVASLRQVNRKLKNLTRTVVEWLTGLREKYGEQFPRRTEIATFHEVDKVAVAKANIRLSYDREAGYFGSSVRGTEFVMTVTEYDRVLAVTADGTYRIMAPPEKAWMPGGLLYAGVFDKAKGAFFTLVYRDANGIAWGKKVHIERFITNKTYWLSKEGSAGIDSLSAEKKTTGTLKLTLVPARRQKVKSVTVDLAKIPVCGLAARGLRLTTKPVQSTELLSSPRAAG